MNNWLPLAITLAIQALVSMAVVTMPVMATVVAAALGVSPALMGLYVTLVYAGAVVASLAAGSAVSRWGAIRASQGGLLLCAAGLLLAVVPSVWTVALGAVLIGLGYGPITPASSHLLALTTPAHRRSLVFSIKQTGVPVGGVLAGAIVPGLLLAAGWQMALVFVAVANVLCALIAQPLRAQLDADRHPDQPLAFGNLMRPLKLVLEQKAIARLAAVSLVFSIVQVCITTYTVSFLTVTLGYTLVQAGLGLAVAQAGGVLGRIAWGWVSDRFLQARRTLAVLAGLMTVCAVAVAFTGASMPVFLVFALMFVYGACGVGWNGVYLAEVARLSPPGMASTITGGTLAVTFFGVIFGPALFGALSGLADSYRAGFMALAVLAAMCLVLLVRKPAGVSQGS